jgi:nicotinamidase-related amidase
MTVRGLEPGRRVALLINECQNAMVDAAYNGNVELAREATERNIIQRISALAHACRAAGALVVHSTVALRRDGLGIAPSSLLLGWLLKQEGCFVGSEGAQIHSELGPQEQDYVSQRLHGVTPFHGTELEPVLRQRGVDTVIVTGVSTNVGIPGTCLELVNRGFSAVVPEDAIAGTSTEIHDFQVATMLRLLATVTSTDEVLAALS